MRARSRLCANVGVYVRLVCEGQIHTAHILQTRQEVSYSVPFRVCSL